MSVLRASYNRWAFAKEWLHENIKGDIMIWIVAALLALCSMLVVYSATGPLAYQKGEEGYPALFLFKHAFVTILGLAFMWFLHRVNYTYFAKISRIALFISIPLLLMLKIPGLGVTEGGATRWLNLGLIKFQPSDFARLALVTNLAAMLANRQKIKYDNQIFGQMIIWVGIICGLLALSSFSTAVLLGVSCFLMLFAGRVPMGYLLAMVFLISTVGYVGLSLGQRKSTADGRLQRFWSGNEYQAQQGFIAIAHGKTFGTGVGLSHQRNYLTQGYSDFAYAIIIEEWGLIGGVFVLLLYLVLLVRGIRNIRQTNKPFGGLLSVGLTLSIVLQALMNMCVAVGIIPVTGQPLPILSMGGTSVVFTCISLGIILSVSRGEVDESNL
jgi:cell division protein FtsW